MGVGQTAGTSGDTDTGTFFALAVLFVALLLISLFLFGLTCTVPPL